MSATVYAETAALPGTSGAAIRHAGVTRSIFGDLVICVFLLAQCFDGVFTYVGVASYGVAIEANPLISALMAHVGHGMALLVAKSVAGLLGIALHIRGVHIAVAMLAVFYLGAAVLPWIAVLFS
jgi:uncharacterized membrane protein